MTLKQMIVDQLTKHPKKTREVLDAFGNLLVASIDEKTLEVAYMAICEANKSISSDAAISFLGKAGKNMPFIIKELAGPLALCALDIYHQYYAEDNDKLLSYRDINKDPVLKSVYLANGADGFAFAMATAVNWYISEPDVC